MSRNKKFLAMAAVLLVVIVAVPLFATYANRQPIILIIDGQQIHFEDQGPIIVNDRVLVPVRGVFEHMGFYVTWCATTRIARLASYHTVVVVPVDSNEFVVNNIIIPPDVPQQMINNRVMLPLRAIAEAVGGTAHWDSVSRVAWISSALAPFPAPTPTPTPAPWIPPPTPTSPPSSWWTPPPTYLPWMPPHLIPSPTPTPTPTPAPDHTQPDPDPMQTPQPDVSPTPQPETSPQPVVSPSPEPTPSPLPIASPTPSPQTSPTPSPTPSPQPSPTPPPTLSPQPSPIPSLTPSPQPSPIPSPTPSPQPSPIPSPTPTTPPSPSPAPPLLPQITIPNRHLTQMELGIWIERYNAAGANSLEIQLLNLVNDFRAENGLAPLNPEPRLMRTARFKSQSMLDLGYFSDTHPVYGAFERIQEDLFGFSTTARADAVFSRWHPNAEAVIAAWLNMPDRRATMLNPNYVHAGVGAINVSTGQGSFDNLWTMVFTEREAGEHPRDIPESSIQLPNERLTQQQIDQWIAEYISLGGANAFELEVIRLTNIERANYGLAPLSLNDAMMMSARFISHSMADLNYFEHTHPIYGHFTNAPRYVFNATVLAENIALWQQTPEEVVAAWMDSPPHREAILTPQRTQIGVGFFRGRWTQLFA